MKQNSRSCDWLPGAYVRRHILQGIEDSKVAEDLKDLTEANRSMIPPTSGRDPRKECEFPNVVVQTFVLHNPHSGRYRRTLSMHKLDRRSQQDGVGRTYTPHPRPQVLAGLGADRIALPEVQALGGIQKVT